MDDFILNEFDYGRAVWVCTLSNGEVVYQDDNKYGYDDVAWKRLQKYCLDKSVHPIHMGIRFRSHYEDCGTSSIGFFFRRGIKAGLDYTNHYYIVGRIEQDKVYTKKFRVPKLLLEEEDVRELKDCLEHSILSLEEDKLWNQKNILVHLPEKNVPAPNTWQKLWSRVWLGKEV